MRRYLILFIILIFIFDISVSAKSVKNNSVNYNVAGKKTINRVYKPEKVYIDVTAVDGTSYQMEFSASDVYKNGKIIITKAEFLNNLNSISGNRGDAIINPILAGQGGKIKTRADIGIYDQTNNKGNIIEQHIRTIKNESEIDTLPLGLKNSDLINMHKWFNFNVKDMLRASTPQSSSQPKQSTAGSHMDMVAEFKEFSDSELSSKKPGSPNGFLIDHSLNPNYLGSANNPLIIKAGYGIPVTAEIQGFDFAPKMNCCCQTWYARFSMNPIIKINSPNLNTFWKTHASLDIDTLAPFIPWSWRPGLSEGETWKENEYFRASLKHNSNYPLNYRKIYTRPSQEDGDYTIVVSGTSNSYWEEYVYDPCYYYSCGKDCTCCECPNGRWELGTPLEVPVQEVTLYVTIKGSMFDDDQVTVIQ